MLRRVYTDEMIAQAILLSDELGTRAAAKQLNMPEDTLHTWRTNSRTGAPRRLRTYKSTFKKKAVTVAVRTSIKSAAKRLDVPYHTLRTWVFDAGHGTRQNRRYTEEERERAVALLREVGALVAEQQLGIPERLLRDWERKRRRPEDRHPGIRHYTAQQKSEALVLVAKMGVVAASEQLGISPTSLNVWRRKSGVPRLPSKSSDLQFTYLTLHEGMEDWRALATKWIQGEQHSLSTKLEALRKFFELFVVGKRLPREPSILLARETRLPDFFSSVLTDTTHSRTCVNYVNGFLEWVLDFHFSIRDGDERPVRVEHFRNPVDRIENRPPRHAQSVYTALPYGYIDEIRALLAQGPNFSDWVWAQQALGSKPGTKGTSGPDWFKVPQSLIDKSDPDCVYRTKLKRKGRGGATVQMWSPVRWVALLIKLMLPLRTLQVRMLDSGESDSFRFDYSAPKGCRWAKNERRVGVHRTRKPWSNGVIRQSEATPFPIEIQPSTVDSDAVLYINTNKTADRGQVQKGYALPWYSSGHYLSDPFFWFDKLRKWQEKYNPVKRRTAWSELTGLHMNVKSRREYAKYPETCFLFRTPEVSTRIPASRSPSLPVTQHALERPWYVLLELFEGTLATRGEKHADGSRVCFVVPSSEKTTHFPLHSLRVSLITAFALEGSVPFPILQKLVGHSRLLMTLYYFKPGELHFNSVLRDAFSKLDAAKDASIVRFLRNSEYSELIKNAIANSKSSLSAAIPQSPNARNAAGWMPMSIGLCLVGGNVSPHDSAESIGGCYNGGADIGTHGKAHFKAVPGGARNCIRCRWFVTQPGYLVALEAHFNTIIYHYDVARHKCYDLSEKIDALTLERVECENAGKPFSSLNELKIAKRRLETELVVFGERAEDAAACFRLIHRCMEALNEQSKSAGDNALVAVGTEHDVRIAIEEIDSELLQLTTVCEAVELYPELDSGKAVFLRSQLYDAVLRRNGAPPLFAFLSEAEQLKLGNEFGRNLGRARNPQNPHKGFREVVNAIESGKSLFKHLGLDIASLIPKPTSSSRLPLKTASPSAA